MEIILFLSGRLFLWPAQAFPLMKNHLLYETTAQAYNFVFSLQKGQTWNFLLSFLFKFLSSCDANKARQKKLFLMEWIDE